MLDWLAEGTQTPSLAILFLFGIFYAISTLMVVCLLMFSAPIRLRNTLIASLAANVVSMTVSLISITFIFYPLTLHSSLVFSVSNMVLQAGMLIFAYGVRVQSFLLPLVIGNSLAYWLVFPNVIRLLQL